MDTLFDCLRELNIYSMILRLTLALLLGGVVGFDREKKGRPAGFRTYMLVALDAAVAMILTIPEYNDQHCLDIRRGIDEPNTDVVRLGAQVINGIGFLGTGTTLVTSKSQVKGLTTASGLWASACMGLAAGAGFYEATLFGFILIFLSIKVLPYIENTIHGMGKHEYILKRTVLSMSAVLYAG